MSNTTQVNAITPKQYLQERMPFLHTDIASLMREYSRKKNIPQSEVFGIMGKYWDNQPSVDGSATLMAQIWFCAAMNVVNDEELNGIFDWFYN